MDRFHVRYSPFGIDNITKPESDPHCAGGSALVQISFDYESVSPAQIGPG
jgi:hypothetical protein